MFVRTFFWWTTTIIAVSARMFTRMATYWYFLWLIWQQSWRAWAIMLRQSYCITTLEKQISKQLIRSSKTIRMYKCLTACPSSVQMVHQTGSRHWNCKNERINHCAICIYIILIYACLPSSINIFPNAVWRWRNNGSWKWPGNVHNDFPTAINILILSYRSLAAIIWS